MRVGDDEERISSDAPFSRAASAVPNPRPEVPPIMRILDPDSLLVYFRWSGMF
jgi:hypothetical protein